MLHPLLGIIGTFGPLRVERPLTDRIKHGLIFLHRVHNTARVARPLERDSTMGRYVHKVRHNAATRQQLAGVAAPMHGSVFAGKELHGGRANYFVSNFAKA